MVRTETIHASNGSIACLVDRKHKKHIEQKENFIMLGHHSVEHQTKSTENKRFIIKTKPSNENKIITEKVTKNVIQKVTENVTVNVTENIENGKEIRQSNRLRNANRTNKGDIVLITLRLGSKFKELVDAAISSRQGTSQVRETPGSNFYGTYQ